MKQNYVPPLDEPLPSNDEVDAFFASLPPKRARKLSFSEQCGLAYALSNLFPNAVVIKSFGLSPATVSHLGNCLKANSKHYPAVRAEYESLGAVMFKEKHYLPLHWRLTRTDLGLNHLPGGEADIAHASGPDPRATKYSFDVFGCFEAGASLQGDVYWWRIDWRTGLELPGWYFSPCTATGDKPIEWAGKAVTDWPIYGQNFPVGDLVPFATSAKAYDAAFAAAGFDSPRAKPGRKPL